MSFGGGRRLSLVEQKKLQWAKEREEMVGLCGLWGPVVSTSKTSDHIGVGIHGSKADNESRFGGQGQFRSELGKQNVDYGSTQRFENGHSKRSSSLPPIGSRSYSKQQMEEECAERDDSVATSGYNSDSAGSGCRPDAADPEGRNREWPPQQEVDTEDRNAQQTRTHSSRLSRHAGWKQKEDSRWQSEENMEISDASQSNADAMETASRARWGDHGVGVGHLWEPAPMSASAPRLPPVAGRAETPAWLSRGLDRLQLGDKSAADALVSPGRDMSTPSISEPSGNDSLHESFGRSFLRGQNIPLEADILAERQKRREKAISHQNAIRQQVEERDRKRKEERELKLKMELVEEERLRQEQEKLRLQEQLDRQRIAERQEMEAKRLAAMAEALHVARENAKDENSRLRRKHLQRANAEEMKPRHRADDTQVEAAPSVPRAPSREELKAREDKQEEIDHTTFVAPQQENKAEEKHIPTATVAPEVAPTLPVPIAPSSTEAKAQSWVPVVEMYSPDRLTSRSLSTGHSTMLLPPGLAHQTVSPLCLVSPDGNYTPIPSAFPLQFPLPFIPVTQNGVQLALVIPTVQESTEAVRRREVGTQTSAGRRRGGWEGSGSSGNAVSKHRCDRSTVTERPQWGVNRSGAKYVKQSDKDLSFRQRGHRSQRRRLLPPTVTIANGDNSCARNRWWSTVQLSDDELSKTYHISSNPVSSGSSSSGSGVAKARNNNVGDLEDERELLDEQEYVNESETCTHFESMHSTVPTELISQLSALKIVR